MKRTDFYAVIDNLKIENSVTKKLIFVLAIANVLLGVLLYVSYNREKIIVLPTSNPENAYWIKNDMVSVQYMELLSRDIMSLTLNISPETVQKQYEGLVKLVTPELRRYIVDNLKQSADDVIKNNVTKNFYIDEMRAILVDQTVYISGYLETYINKQQVNNIEQIYKIKFMVSDLTAKVSEFRLLDPNKDSAEIKKVGL